MTWILYDGYREIKKNVSTTNGQFIINNLSYVRNESGVDVVISNIKTPNGCWDPSSYSINGESVTGDITINVNEASVTTDINLNRTKYDMGESGISGRITAPRSVVMDSTGKSVEHTLDSLVVEVEINGKVDYVLAGNGNYDSENAGSFSVDFSGLAINEKVEKTTNTTITVKVFKQGTETFTGTPLGSTTLNLDSNYSGKNSVNIFIDSWT